MADTVLAAPGPAPGPAPSAPPAAAGQRRPRPARAPERPILQAVGVGLLLLAVLALGLAGYLYFLSGVQEARSQTILYTRLQ